MTALRDDGMYRALEAGMPSDLVAYLSAGRAHWRTVNAGMVGEPDGPLPDELAAMFWELLDEALAHPAAPLYDQVFVAAMRRQRGLRSPAARNVNKAQFRRRRA